MKAFFPREGFTYFLFLLTPKRLTHTLSPIVVPLVELLEADVLGVLPEALAAKVQVVLADEAVTVGAGAAETRNWICSHERDADNSLIKYLSGNR